ncbi:MAG: DNA methylase, partial [Chitinophagales bacterium]|nr:DNA methylase [Chitinophagales bacterium]
MFNQIIQGNCIEVLAQLPEKSVDLIFADPP